MLGTLDTDCYIVHVGCTAIDVCMRPAPLSTLYPCLSTLMCLQSCCQAKQKAQSRLAEVQKQHAEEEQKLARLVEQDRKLEAEYKSKQERLNQLVAEQRQHVQQ